MKIAIEDTTTVNKASGDIVSFEATSVQPLQSLTVHVEPVQDLHGYENPWPGGGGKNKLKITATSTTINGITYTVNADGTIVANGTASDDSTFVLTNGTGIFNFDSEMILNGSVSGFEGNVRIRFGVTNPGFVYDDFGNGVTIPQISDISTRYAYVQISIANGTTVNNIVFKPMIRLASVSDATFAPYSNICPISGWTGANVSRTGVNVWDGTNELGYIDMSNGQEAASDSTHRSLFVPISPSKSYCYVNENVSSGIRLAFYDKDKTFISSIANNNQNPQVFTSPSNARYCRFYSSYVSKISINYPSSDTSYYSGADNVTLPISWQSEAGTVYGGTLDVTSGKLTVAKAIVDLGTFGWSKSSGTYGGFYATNAFYYRWASDTKMLCSRYKFDGVRVSASYFGDNGTLTCYFGSAQPVFEIYIKDESLADKTASEFKTEMSGVQLVYELYTPITVQLTPTQVKTLLGTNNIWADAGEIDVEWRGTWKDITGWIAWQGLDFSRNDIDASDAGRDINGKMQRGRIAIKEKMTVRTVQLDQNDIATVHALCEPSQFNVRVNPYPRTNGEKVMTMYTNNVKTDYVIHRENGNDLQELSFPLIEI